LTSVLKPSRGRDAVRDGLLTMKVRLTNMHGQSEDIADSGLTMKGLAKKATHEGTAVLLCSIFNVHKL
jgi:hypothetical protein